jgi:hypothetical protein
MSDIPNSDQPIRGRNGPSALIEEHEFSPVLGGPWLQLLCRTHLSGPALELLRRRIIVIPILAWGPLLILSSLDGHAWGAAGRVPFLMDIELHLRLLVALPMLIAAELVVHQRLRLVVGQFEAGGLISEASHDAFEAAIRSALRLRNSRIAEMILIAVVYLFGVLYVWPQFSALNVPTWYANPVGSGHRFSAAGWWFVLVSLPLFQFILLRWYFRLFVWFRFLWQVARCKLCLVPTHPDRVGGLGFLSLTPMALAFFLAAQGVALAGMIADQIFFHGARLLDFKVEVISIVAFLLFVVLAPLVLFAPHLLAMKRRGLVEYGSLAQRYVREFDAKWMRGGAPAGESFLGSSDIQSLADLGNSFGIIEGIRLAPIKGAAIVQLTLLTVLPLAPLLLTMISLGALIKQLLKVLL